jgi:hypothetical protein
MPEEQEVDLDHLKEAVAEEVERESGSLVRRIAVTTAIIAAVAAIGSLLAGGAVNEALILKTEAAELQTRASDQWAYYQAKGIKAAVATSVRASYEVAAKEAPPSVEATIHRYEEEQKEIQAQARELEKERDRKTAEAATLMHRHEHLALSVTMLQISIALAAVAALLRHRLLWMASAVLGIAGVAALLVSAFAG